MLIKLDTPQVFSKVVDIISDLVLEVKIKVDDMGMRIVAMDPANVAMVEFKLPRTAFSQFEVKEETLGVNLDNLKRILKRAGARSSLIMERKENMLNVQIQDRIKSFFPFLIKIMKADIKKITSPCFYYKPVIVRFPYRYHLVIFDKEFFFLPINFEITIFVGRDNTIFIYLT